MNQSFRTLCTVGLIAAAVGCGSSDVKGEQTDRVASATTLQSGSTLFAGRNIYSPTVIFDDQEQIYKMWYGGWQTQSDYPNDHIFYRSSVDSVRWSDPVTVVSPKSVLPTGVHANDPNVTKTYNTLSKTYQYTMFYTFCTGGCTDAESSIWSAVSADGLNWYYHQAVMTGGTTNPSVIYEPGAGGAIWKLYFINRVEGALNVKMVPIGGARTPVGSPSVVHSPANTTVGDVEVRKVGGVWQLFYNKMGLNLTDIYVAQSKNNTSFAAPAAPFLVMQGSPVFCAALTPGILPTGGSNYKMFFSLTQLPLNAGQCDLSNRTLAMQLWNLSL